MHLYSKQERLARFAIALLVMILGSAGVLSLVLAMNSLTPPKKEAKVDYKEMTAAQKKKPKPKKKRREQKKQRPKRTTRKAAPAPVISTAISGLSFDLPQMEGFGLGEAVDQLIGEQAVKDMVMTPESVDVVPEPVYEGTLEYPARARRNNQEGYVVINMLIGADGAVEKVNVLESVPVGVFDSVTLNWAKNLRFTPAYYNGKPVKTWARRRIPFKLSG
ncbi:MAG: energy transducer TonB [Deltaproteobacteria bacterium]|nr:energy transducer TonB [Deltaproteobacteria bacterium]